MTKVPYPYEINGKLVTENGSLIPICTLSNRFLLPSLTVSIIMENKTLSQKFHTYLILFGFLIYCELNNRSSLNGVKQIL